MEDFETNESNGSMEDSHCVRRTVGNVSISNRKYCFLKFVTSDIFVSGKQILSLDVGIALRISEVQCESSIIATNDQTYIFFFR